MSSENNSGVIQLSEGQAHIVEQVVMKGDLANMSQEDRVNYYRMVCNSVGLNPLTRPFEYITLNGKLTLYARKDCTDQLRKIHGVSIIDVTGTKNGDLVTYKAVAEDKTGRKDCDIGSVNVGRLSGDALANAMMKAMTKAKRRVTLSICGLGILDETELETIPNAHPPSNGTYDTEGAEPQESPKLRTLRLISDWSGVENGDLKDAARKTVAAAGVLLNDGEQMTDEQWEDVEAWCSAHKNQGNEWTTAVENTLVN